MKRNTRKLKAETIRTLTAPPDARGGITPYTTTSDEACSGPCCTKVTVSWCVGGGGQ